MEKRSPRENASGTAEEIFLESLPSAIGEAWTILRVNGIDVATRMKALKMCATYRKNKKIRPVSENRKIAKLAGHAAKALRAILQSNLANLGGVNPWEGNYFHHWAAAFSQEDGEAIPPYLSDKGILNALRIVEGYFSPYQRRQPTRVPDRLKEDLMIGLDMLLSPKKRNIRSDAIYRAIGILTKHTTGSNSALGIETTKKLIQRRKRRGPALLAGWAGPGTD